MIPKMHPVRLISICTSILSQSCKYLNINPILIHVVDEVCSEEVQKQCSARQRWLRMTPIFKDCHCHVTTAQRAECMDIQRTVFDDYCGNGQIGRACDKPKKMLNYTNVVEKVDEFEA